MHLAGRMFLAPASYMLGQTFSRTCTDLTFKSPIGTWNLVEAQPAPDLNDAIECYWEGWGDIPPLTEKILPRTGVELMFNLKGDHVVRELDGKPLGTDYQLGWLSGLQRRYMVIETTGGSHFIAARLKPWGAWRLLREPMRDVSCRVPLIDDIWASDAERLSTRLAEAPNLYARFDLLEDYLRRRIDFSKQADASVVEASRRMLGSRGRVRINSICQSIGTSRVTLSRKFREQVGLTPKTYSRVVRIESLMTHLATNGNDSWAMLAEDYGYHDQAHLSHDIQEFCGATLTEYLRRASPDGGATIED
ncbi:MAG TPA: helix-turn-helix domain-containing protein [Xanthomonadales bacterium]|nr:helix-turn-helix domain-containing protein [Xanthomonadales bacterium]